MYMSKHAPPFRVWWVFSLPVLFGQNIAVALRLASDSRCFSLGRPTTVTTGDTVTPCSRHNSRKCSSPFSSCKLGCSLGICSGRSVLSGLEAELPRPHLESLVSNPSSSYCLPFYLIILTFQPSLSSALYILYMVNGFFFPITSCNCYC